MLHEYAHGWVAYKCGDVTAKLAGRLTLNPLKHIDPVGSILVPGVLIGLRAMGYSDIPPLGWAKPVPVNFMGLRSPKRDMIWVAIAGPGVNIGLAIACSLCIKFLNLPPAAVDIFALGLFINLLLALFNLIPIPPLDGSRILMGILPHSIARPYSRLEPYGLLIIFGLLYFGMLGSIVLPALKFFSKLLGVNIG